MAKKLIKQGGCLYNDFPPTSNMKYIKYLNYLIQHRWYVMLECFGYGLYWRGIVHDLSKFYPDEFFPFVKYYFGGNEKQKDRYKNIIDFNDNQYNIASLKHEHRNKHHWQYWVRVSTSAGRKPLKMPEKYVIELYCDWYWASKLQGNDLKEWYEKNKNNIEFHPETREVLEGFIYT